MWGRGEGRKGSASRGEVVLFEGLPGEGASVAVGQLMAGSRCCCWTHRMEKQRWWQPLLSPT